MVENWFIALGLDLEASSVSSKEIDEAIRKKSGEWRQRNRTSSDAREKASAEALLGQMEKMRQDLNDPKTQRRQANDAKKIVYGTIDDFLKTASGDAMLINSDQVEGVAKLATGAVRTQAGVFDFGVSRDMVEKRAGVLGISVSAKAEESGASHEAAVARYRTWAENVPAFAKQPRTILRKLDGNLATLAVGDLFEFACPDYKGDRRALSPQKLLDGAKAQSDACAKHRDAKASAASALYATIQTKLKTQEEVRDYVDYLQWRAVEDVLGSFGEEARLLFGGTVKEGETMAENALDKLVGCGLGREDARLLLIGYCEASEGLLFIDVPKTQKPTDSAKISLRDCDIELSCDHYARRRGDMRPKVKVKPPAGAAQTSTLGHDDYDVEYIDKGFYIKVVVSGKRNAEGKVVKVATVSSR